MASPEHAWDPDQLAEHAGWIRRLAFELVGDDSTADDLVQETWLALFLRRPRTDHSMRPWLSAVMRNQAASLARKRAARRAREESTARQEGLPDTHELVERVESGRRLAELVLELEDPYRSTLLLRFYEDRSPREIAHLRGLPPATVRTHLSRGLEMLRARLRAQDAGGPNSWMPALLALARRPARRAAWTGGSLRVALLIVASLSLASLAGVWLARPDAPARGQTLAAQRAGAEVTAELEQMVDERDARAALSDPSDARPAPLASAARWRVIAQQDSAPLAGYQLRVEDETLTSDADGWLDAPARLRAPRAINADELWLDVRVAHRERELRPALSTQLAPASIDPVTHLVAVPTGPCFELDLSGAACEVAQLEARLLPSASASSSASASASASGESAAAAELDALTLQVARVRPPEAGFTRHWVRFAAVPEGIELAGLRWRLELRDREGLRHGEVAAAEVRGARTQVVALCLQATGVLECRFEPELGAVAALVAIDHPERGRRVANALAGGLHELRWVQPGRYTLFSRVPGHETRPRTIELLGDQRLRESIECVSVSLPSSIEGLVRSQSGRCQQQLLVFLLPADAREPEIFATSWRETPDGLVAAFRFEGVAAGEYTLDVLSLESAVGLVGELPVVSAPVAGLELVLRDAALAADWVVRVVDDQSGRPVPRYDFELRFEGGGRRTFQHHPDPERPWRLVSAASAWNRFAGEAPLRACAADARFEWSILADGYRAAGGDAAAFDDAGSERRELRVRLLRER